MPFAVLLRRATPFVLLLLGSGARGQDLGAPVRLDPPLRAEKAPPDRVVPKLVRSAGNEVYRVFVEDESGGACGAWTATTGSLHEAGPGLNVLYGNAQPWTSDTTLRSWSSGEMYRTGYRRDCNAMCAADATPTLVPLYTDFTLTGYRLTWQFADGGNSIEFVQEVKVEGPVDGTQTVDNTAIRETHRVRNLGPGVFRFGLRKQWDWEIDGDDGPWFATCEHVNGACDRSMTFQSDGGGAGLYPNNYVINQDPDYATCPSPIVPRHPAGCSGMPIYIIAGTVAPPSGLVPPPDAPEWLVFNSWPRLIDDCWMPPLEDAALCGDSGSPSDDTAIAYFYGATSASAIVLQPGQERALTEYVVAATSHCPSILSDPTAHCDAGGPYELDCAGASRITLQLDAVATVSEGNPIISWTNDCPGGSFDDPTIEDPLLSWDVEGCSSGCGITLTVRSDAGGEPRTCTTFVTVNDTTPPALTCPPPRTFECRDGGVRSTDSDVAAWLAMASATGACSSATVSNDMPPFVAEQGCSTGRTVTFTATDACGNVASCTATLTVADTLAPAVTPPPDHAQDCNDPPSDQQAWRGSASAADRCSGTLPVASQLVSSSSPCPGTTIERWQFTATDDCGRVGVAYAEWRVGDGTPPVVTPPPPREIECGPGAAQAENDWLALASALDACQGVRPIVRTLIGSDPGCTGEQVRHWRFSADDGCGNVGESFQDLVIRDRTAPTLSGVPSDATAACDAVPAPPVVTASDACDPSPSVRFSESSAPGRCPQERTITRTWTGTDACGNAASRSQRITVVDQVAPTLSGVPSDATVACDAVPAPPVVTASDACDPSPSVTFSETSAPGRCPQERTITRTWTGTDACGNAASRSQRITVVDQVAPTLSGVPSDATVACDAVPAPPVVTASDACDPSPSVAFSEASAPGRCPQERTITRTWTGTDACGNAASRSQRITVVDQLAPTLNGVPSDATVACDAVPAPPVVTASDACDPSPSVAFSETSAPGRCPQERTITRTWTGTDACGNAASRSQRITVVDQVAPTLNGVPSDATVACDAVPALPVVTASDACDPSPSVTFSETSAPGRCPQERTITRTWTGTDACGNAASRSQRITVVDQRAPTLNGVPSDATVACDAVPAPPVVTASDACDPAPSVTFSETRTPGACPNEWTLRRTWTATDACGNAASRSQVLAVVDRTPPVLVAPADKVVECPAPVGGPDSESAWIASGSATDTCGPARVNSRELLREPGCGGTYRVRREFWAVDACGLESARVTREYRVVDTTPPALAAPADKVVECPPPSSGPDSEAAWIASASATDACGTPTVMGRELLREPGCGGTYRVRREFWAVDACGLESARVTREYRVVDTTPPVLAAPADKVVECPAPSSGPDSEAAWIASASATDACSTPTVMGRELLREPGCGGTYRVRREFWAVDACGLESARVTREYRVVDTTPPALAAPADKVVECPAPSSGPDSEAAWIASASATDACSVPAVMSRELLREPGCGHTFRTLREFWAVDACGLESARVTREYRVVDTTPPAFARAGAQFDVGLWPPNHGYVVFLVADMASATDACGSVDLRATGCSSNQPEDVQGGDAEGRANGDGHFAEDCVLSRDGLSFAVRAERLGSCGADSARRYVIELTATDECGNASRAPGELSVAHDRSEHGPVARGKHLPPNAPPPFPYVHPTVYGRGCD